MFTVVFHFQVLKRRKSLITTFQDHQLCFVDVGAKIFEGLSKWNERQVCCGNILHLNVMSLVYI